MKRMTDKVIKWLKICSEYGSWHGLDCKHYKARRMSDEIKNIRQQKTWNEFFGVLQLIFIVLKLCGLISWGWAVVLIPLWIELFLLFLILVAVYIMD